MQCGLTRHGLVDAGGISKLPKASEWYSHLVWYNLEHEPISIVEAEALLCDIAARNIAVTAIDDTVHVSTVFLVLDHGWDGTPQLYETMIFGGEHDQDAWRYPTRHAALAGHDQVVAMLRQPMP